jgi:hypothetical protein
MMPYHTYRLYQVERAKTPREIQHADGQAALLAAAISRLFRAIAQNPAAARMPYPAGQRHGTSSPTAPGTCCATLNGVMERS